MQRHLLRRRFLRELEQIVMIMAYLAIATKFAVSMNLSFTVCLLINRGVDGKWNFHELFTLLSGLRSRGRIPQRKDPPLPQ